MSPSGIVGGKSHTMTWSRSTLDASGDNSVLMGKRLEDLPQVPVTLYLQPITTLVICQVGRWRFESTSDAEAIPPQIE